jgi:hypothetical protein
MEKPRRLARTGRPPAVTKCARCGKRFPGTVVGEPVCPRCDTEGDKESRLARFAPGKRAPLTSAVPTEPEGET